VAFFSLLAAPVLLFTGPLLLALPPRDSAETSDAAPSEEPYRPQFHYTPPTNWMNDPNGLVYHDGTYHLFHQYNPKGHEWGHMSWYHATSTDLMHWSHQGVALPEEGNEMIFSGSAVVDAANTSGFGTGGNSSPMVAIYTSHYTLEGNSSDQAQSLAYSTDGGATWTKYQGNPVLEHPDPEFRDPYVFWYAPDQRWIMAVALSEQQTVQFYASTNLREWAHLSDFGPAGATGGIWECPLLFQVPFEDSGQTRWILKVDLNPGAVAGGSGGQYFVGDFDGTTFTPHHGVRKHGPHWVDYGPDFYAAMAWNHVPESDGRALWMGWMNNWAYAKHLPTPLRRSAQTIPRSLHLRPLQGEPRLVQQPVEELQRLREQHVHLDSRPLAAGATPLKEAGISGRSLELVAVFEPKGAKTVGLHVRAGTDEKTVIGYDVEAEAVFVDRSASGVVDAQSDIPSRSSAPLSLQEGRVKLHVFVDRSSVEVFANDGARVLTHRIAPTPKSEGVSLVRAGSPARLVRLDAWSLRSIWNDS